MHSHPRVSVIIPAFQAGGYLHYAVECALSQTWKNVEVIVAPADAAIAAWVLGTVKSPRVRVLPRGRQADASASETRNRAIDASTGEYLVELDADDLIPPDYISELFMACMGIGAACSATQYVTWDGKSKRQIRMPDDLTFDGAGKLLASVRTMTHRSFECGYVGGYAEDVVRLLRVCHQVGGLLRVVEPIYKIRQRETQVSQRHMVDEQVIHSAYARYADDALHHPTALGIQSMPFERRVAFSEAFRFRAFVSDLYAHGKGGDYHHFVAGREERLWDEFHGTGHDTHRTNVRSFSNQNVHVLSRASVG